jgi:peptidoglycan hydrolase-like protein with peptidoglycan-binding domain
MVIEEEFCKMVETSTLRKLVISSTFATGIVLAAPLVADAALGDQTLREGMNHSDVVELQDALKQKGYFHFERSTGYYGTITTEAVRRFQRENNLQVDGIAGPQTLGALLTKMGGQAPSAATSTNTTTQAGSASTNILRIGSKGRGVETLQRQLKDRGFYTSTITGTFGPITEAAVRDYQRASRLTVDGIAGPQTLNHLANNTVTRETRNEQTASNVVTSPTQNTTLLRVGMRGTAVTELQSQLRSVGLMNINPTGYFGEVTATAVRNFQRVHNLTADGIAGPKTRSKLNEVATNRSSTPTVSAPSNTTAEPSRSGTGNAAFVTNLVAEAANLVGVPYLWGGTTPRGFDCSGFLQYVFRQQGITIPRTAAQQFNFGRTVSQPAVGDVVFFETYAPGPSHNGIYIGNNQFVHSGSSTGVTIASMNNSYWSKRYLGAKRLH